MHHEASPVGPPDNSSEGASVKQRQTGKATNAFRAVLHPHRSLSQKGFMILMLFLGGVSFITGVAFLMLGAWPVDEPALPPAGMVTADER